MQGQSSGVREPGASTFVSADDLRASLPCGQGPSTNSRGATQYGREDNRTARGTTDQGGGITTTNVLAMNLSGTATTRLNYPRRWGGERPGWHVLKEWDDLMGIANGRRHVVLLDRKRGASGSEASSRHPICKESTDAASETRYP